MKISVNYFTPIVKDNNTAVKKQSNNNFNNQYNEKLMSYPSNYYLNVNFGRKSRRLSNSYVIEKIGIENFPSPKIAEIMVDDAEKTLYDAHTEYYADLLECKTLEQAKEKYPEFNDVIDAKDIDINSLNKQSTLYKISQGQINEANLDTLSLDLLKKYYGEVLSKRGKQQNYYGLSDFGVTNLMRDLQINTYSCSYVRNLVSLKPENIEKNRQRGIAQFDINKEAGRKAREHDRQRGIAQFDINKEAGRKAREHDRQRGIAQFDENTEAGRKARDKASQIMTEFSHCQDRQILRLSCKLSWYFNPELRNKMSKISKGYPNFPELIIGSKNGTMDDFDILRYRKYHKQCNETMPGYKKETIGPINSLIYDELSERIQKVKEDKADDEDLIILSCYYILTKAQAAEKYGKEEYLECFSDIKDKLTNNKQTHNIAVNIMSDYYKNVTEKYSAEITDKYFSGLKKILSEEEI